MDEKMQFHVEELKVKTIVDDHVTDSLESLESFKLHVKSFPHWLKHIHKKNIKTNTRLHTKDLFGERQLSFHSFLLKSETGHEMKDWYCTCSES